MRSKLTRHADPGLDRLYRELIRARRTLGAGDFDEIAFDEDARWVRARRGGHTLLGNFATGPTRIPCESGEIVLSAGGDTHLESGSITLAGMSAALIR